MQYILPAENHVTLEIFDLLGRNIRTLVSKDQAAGAYSVLFDAGDLSNGIYMYQLTAGAFRETRTMILLK